MRAKEAGFDGIEIRDALCNQAWRILSKNNRGYWM